ncbi:MAG: NADH-quinone oxidoreductase subunit NuoH [Nitrospirae bacterium]|nr:NADH-quinone oxidoreductase subunit NuoH [Nitrospirota bacterium]
MSDSLIMLLIILVKLALILVVTLTLAAYMVLAERKLLGRMQNRYGPNRVGPFGLLQPLADLIKLITKEDIMPDDSDRAIYYIAPGIVAGTVLLTFAVVPFGAPFTVKGHTVGTPVIDLNVGLLYFLALSSLGVYGVALAGWASGSKYSLLGGIRGSAQMISYELSMGLALAPVVMLAGSFSLVDIVGAQSGWWFIVYMPLGFTIFLISVAAESKRIPFDLPEAENELVAGYHTEYSGMRFGLFFVGEYINLIVLSALATTFFLGGWHGPGPPWLSFFWFSLKSGVIAFFFIWMRATLPRLRYDRLMHFGWQVLVPLSLLNIVLTGALALLFGWRHA